MTETVFAPASKHTRAASEKSPGCKNIVHQNHRTASHTSSPRRVYRHRSMQQFPAFLSSMILKLRCTAALLQPIQTALKSRHLRHLLRNERRLIKPPAPLPLPMQRNWNQHRSGWKNIRAPAQHPMGKRRYEIMPIWRFRAKIILRALALYEKTARPLIQGRGLFKQSSQRIFASL